MNHLTKESKLVLCHRMATVFRYMSVTREGSLVSQAVNPALSRSKSALVRAQCVCVVLNRRDTKSALFRDLIGGKTQR